MLNPTVTSGFGDTLSTPVLHNGQFIKEEPILPVLINNESIIPELLDSANLFKEEPKLPENHTQLQSIRTPQSTDNEKQKETNISKENGEEGERDPERNKVQLCQAEVPQEQPDSRLPDDANNNTKEDSGLPQQDKPHQILRDQSCPAREQNYSCCESKESDGNPPLRRDVVDEAEGSSLEDLLMSFDEEKEVQNISSDSATIQSSVQLEESTESLENDINPLWVLDSITASVSTPRSSNDRIGEDQATCEGEGKDELTEENIERLYLQQNEEGQVAKGVGNGHCLLRRKLSTIDEEAKRMSLCSDDTGSLSHSRVLEETVDSLDMVQDVSHTESLSSMTVDEGIRPLSQSSDDVESFSQFRLFGPPVDATNITNSQRMSTASLTSTDEESKRSSQSSDDIGSLGFEHQYEDDLTSYIEGEDYFKNLPTFHQLLTSAENRELSESEKAQCDLQEHSKTGSEFQSLSEFHEQNEFTCDMEDTDTVSSEYWDYPFPSRGDKGHAAANSEDHTGVLESMRMRVRERFRHLANSSSDSGCQDDVANSSFDDPDIQDDDKHVREEFAEVRTHGTTNDPVVEATSQSELLVSRRKILENVQRILESTDRSSGTQINGKTDASSHTDSSPWDADIENDKCDFASTPAMPFPFDDNFGNGNSENSLYHSIEPVKEYSKSIDFKKCREDSGAESMLCKNDNCVKLFIQPISINLQVSTDTKSSIPQRDLTKDISSRECDDKKALTNVKSTTHAPENVSCSTSNTTEPLRTLGDFGVDNLVNSQQLVFGSHNHERHRNSPSDNCGSPNGQRAGEIVSRDKPSTPSNFPIISQNESNQATSETNQSVLHDVHVPDIEKLKVDGDIDLDLLDAEIQAVTKKLHAIHPSSLPVAMTSKAGQVRVDDNNSSKYPHQVIDSSQSPTMAKPPSTRQEKESKETTMDKNAKHSDPDLQAADSKIKRIFKSDNAPSHIGDSATEKSTDGRTDNIPTTDNEAIDIDLSDSKVQEVTKKMQGMFRKRKNHQDIKRTQTRPISGASNTNGPIRGGDSGGSTQLAPSPCDVNNSSGGAFHLNGGGGNKPKVMLSNEGLPDASATAPNINVEDSPIIPIKQVKWTFPLISPSFTISSPIHLHEFG